ncbi:Bromodomain-containing factor 1, partial [Grifola frondosa]
RIKTLAQLRISCPPKSHLLSCYFVTLYVTVTRRPAMNDAPTSNGFNHINSVSAPDSPAVDSPATPVDNSVDVDVKIDVDFNEQESDARHEPMPLKIDQIKDASIPQVEDVGEFPIISTTFYPSYRALVPISVTSPNGDFPPPAQLPSDVSMAIESAPVVPTEPLPTKDSDVVMEESNALSLHLNGRTHDSPVATPVSSSLPAVSSSETAVDSLAASSPARKYSDAERASLANVSRLFLCATTGVLIVVHTLLHNRGAPTFSIAQWRFCSSTIRTLKRMKDAGPFLYPVDPIALGIPHYPSIIKHPMDFSTIERKLASSNPSKPDPNPANPRYYHSEDFISDVRLIFTNCVTFNGPEHAVTQMGKRLEAVFDKQVKQMPPPEERKPPPVKKPSTPPPPPPPVQKKPMARRPSTTVPVIRRSDENAGRPKREIHPPPSKDLPYAEVPRKVRKAKAGKNGVLGEQLKFCEKMLKDLHQKQHYNVAHFFYEPVDWIKMQIPEYPKVVKKPMDLSATTSGLMIKNCCTFNPAGNPVHEAGKELQRVFDEKWKNLPPLRSRDQSEDEDEEEEDESEDERSRMIANMESQIESMKNNLAMMKKNGKPEKKEKKKEKREKVAPVASSSKATTKQPKTATGRKKGKKAVTDDDVLTFEQKKDLSDTIGKLDGIKLEKVIQIIHEGVPEIRDSTEEIELEIDTLPASVLTKLYNFVIRPMKPTAAKRSRTGKGTGTGGLKRKSMDEDVETKKIRALEEKLKSFEQGGRGPTPNGIALRGDESEHSSAESSSDESSASESE